MKLRCECLKETGESLVQLQQELKRKQNRGAWTGLMVITKVPTEAGDYNPIEVLIHSVVFYFFLNVPYTR